MTKTELKQWILESVRNELENASKENLMNRAIISPGKYNILLSCIKDDIFKRPKHSINVEGLISLGSDDERCSKHIRIGVTKNNKKIWRQLYELLTHKKNFYQWSKNREVLLFVGKQGKDLIVTVGNRLGVLGFFRLSPDIHDSDFDGEIFPSDDAEYYLLVTKFVELLMQLIEKS